MALKIKRLETKYGAIFEDVYFKLSMIRYVDSTQTLTFKGIFYLSEEIRLEDEFKYIESQDFVGHYTLENKAVNLFESSYKFIKEYAKTVNVQQNMMPVSEEEITKKLDKRYLIFVDAEDC